MPTRTRWPRRCAARSSGSSAHYAALFESSIDLGGGRALVFTGTDDDPDTLATLAEMGFAQPKAVAARVRAWHHGHIRATRDARARELLTELMPRLLQALAEQSDPDAAFERFDEFVTNLPAGVQLFSLFRANPRLLGLVADLMGTAPRLAGHLSRHVSLFEAMLAPDFFEPLPDRAALAAELDRALRRARDFQDVLDAARRWAQGREFQIGLQVLLGLVDGDAASARLTDIAERRHPGAAAARRGLAERPARPRAGRRLRRPRARQARQPRADASAPIST